MTDELPQGARFHIVVTERFDYGCLMFYEVTKCGINPKWQVLMDHDKVKNPQRIDLLGRLGHMVTKDKALLICLGNYDFGDQVRAGEEYSAYNPLDEYLIREHPTMTLQDELRLKLDASEKECADLRTKLFECRRKIGDIQKALHGVDK